eukprot:m.169393 g.169393  ORF g.169393 m.169393 type:complete len:124 (+) comp13481_c0_seq1:1156-1527(+)
MTIHNYLSPHKNTTTKQQLVYVPLDFSRDALLGTLLFAPPLRVVEVPFERILVEVLEECFVAFADVFVLAVWDFQNAVCSNSLGTDGDGTVAVSHAALNNSCASCNASSSSSSSYDRTDSHPN